MNTIPKILGLPNQPTITSKTHIEDDALKYIAEYLWGFLSPLLRHASPRYWGDQCQTLSTFIYAHLVSLGIDADIVIGEVNIDGNLEFDTTLQNIKQEYLYSNSDSDAKQAIHAWVTIGDDVIIDAGLPDRMIRHYNFPEDRMPPIMIGRASDLYNHFLARHDPMLVGTDFIAKTNTHDPRNVAKRLLTNKRLQAVHSEFIKGYKWY